MEAVRTRSFVLYLAAWSTAGVLAWIVFAALTDASTSYRLRHAYWFAAIVLFAGSGLLFSRLLAAKLALDELQARLLVWAVGWGVAAAAGWFLHVLVGGPFCGFVALAALVTSQRPGLRLVMVGLALLLSGRAVMNLVENLLVGGAVTVLAVATMALITSRFWLARTSPLLVFALVAWWGIAWVFAFWIPQAIGFPGWGGYGRTSLEVVIAFALGGVSVARQLSSSVVRGALSWALGGAVASISGIGIDLAFRFAVSIAGGGLIGPGQRFLDVGHCIGMPIGALIALALTWRRAS
jgi:hypothetical protein